MTSQKFIDRIEELRHNTKTCMDDIQQCCCPMFRDIYLNYQFEYWYDGYKYNIWEDDVQLYAVNELPYCYDNGIKNTIFQGKLQDLIDQDKLWPFLLFVNGHVVPWSKITIIKDYDYSYLRIDGETDDFSKGAKILYFPIGSKEIRYGEDEDYSRDPNINGLYFDQYGFYLQNPEFQELSVRLEFTADIYMKVIRGTDTINPDNNENPLIRFEGLPKGKVPSLYNIILFESDGKFMGPAHKLSRITDPFNGAYSTFEITSVLRDLNPYIICMYFLNHTESKSYIYNKEDISESKMDSIIKNYKSEPASIVKDQLFDPFDFSYSYDASYNMNIRNSLRYITRYDYSLWNKIFIDESPIKSFTYTGKEFKQLADIRSYVRFSRKHSDLIEDVVMMFVNSELYEHSIDISYTNNTINIPAFGIMDDDVVEIVLFTKCNNNVLNIVVKDEVTPVYIHPEYNLNDCYIMDDQTALTSYPDTPTSAEGRRQYICDIKEMRADNNNNYLIEFEDVSHYGRTLKIVPKNQFRYYKYSNVEGQHKIVLPQQFNYCHDIDRYMIFVNGRKIDKTEYTVTIMNQYRPFDRLVLYITTILDETDRVDVFYVPEYLVEKYKTTQTTYSGTILLKTNYPKMYALSKNTCMVFVNGLKINPKDIKDVDMNKMLINTKYNSIYNVTVVEYIDGSKEIARYLYGLSGVSPLAGDTTYKTGIKTLEDICGVILSNSNSGSYGIGVEDLDFTKYVYDQWTNMIDQLQQYLIGLSANDNEDEEYENAISVLYDMFPSLDPSSVDKDYKNDYGPLKSVLYDIVVDYYIQRNDVTTGSVFTYDFEIEEWNKDNDGNADITLYPDHDKLFDYNLDIEEASSDEVENGKLYLPV